MRVPLVIALTIAAVACKTSSDSNAESDISSAGPGVDLPDSTMPVIQQPWVEDCKTLNYGIFWFGPGGVAQHAEDGHKSQFFDKSRPTVMYVHGWQNNAHVRLAREAYYYLDPTTGQSQFTADAWVKAGWNVGLFSWNQFADDSQLVRAEAKIWQADAAKGNSWATCDGSPSWEGSPKGPLAKVFYDNFLQAMKGYTGNNVRIVGHSLGNQMAASLTSYLLDAKEQGLIPDNLVPQRLALVDPYWSLGNSITQYPGARVRDIVKRAVDNGIAVEMFKTSDLLALGSLFGGGDTNVPLTAMIGESRMDLAYLNSKNPIAAEKNRHIIAPAVYFTQFASPPPKGCAPDCDQTARSAATSDKDTLSMAKNAVIWQQNVGGSTFTGADDSFTKVTN